MTCYKCEEEQNNMERIAYVRVGKANVGIIGCEEHVAELIRRHRFYLERQTP